MTWPAAPGTYVLTARATGENGTVLESSPITIRVDPLDLKLHVQLGADGALMFVLPEGSLVAGGFAMELSHNLETWEWLGTFDPGNVAAFFRDRPDSADGRPRYYRAVRKPGHLTWTQPARDIMTLGRAPAGTVLGRSLGTLVVFMGGA